MITSLRLYPFRLTIACSDTSCHSVAASTVETDPDPATWKVFRGHSKATPVAAPDAPHTLRPYSCRLCGRGLLTVRQIGIARTLWQAGGAPAVKRWLAEQLDPEPCEVVFEWEYTSQGGQGGGGLGWWCSFVCDREEYERARRENDQTSPVFRGVTAGLHKTDPWTALAHLLRLPAP